MTRVLPRAFAAHRVRPVDHYGATVARRAAVGGARAAGEDPDRGRPDAGGLQLRLLRARLPGPADGGRAGRGPRPGRRRARGLHAHHPRACGGSTSSTGASTTTSSTRSCSDPTRCSACRGWSAATGRQRHHRQRGRQRRRRRQGRLRLRARPDPLLPGRGADPAQRGHLPAVGRRAAPDVLDRLDELVVKPVARVRRLRHADRARTATADEIADFRAQARGRPARLHRAGGRAVVTHPTLVGDRHRRAAHIDLRPFVLSGETVTVVPGGLTRVALAQGLAGGELLAGRRFEGHLGPRDPTGRTVMMLARACREPHVGRTLHRARRGLPHGWSTSPITPCSSPRRWRCGRRGSNSSRSSIWDPGSGSATTARGRLTSLRSWSPTRTTQDRSWRR